MGELLGQPEEGLADARDERPPQPQQGRHLASEGLELIAPLRHLRAERLELPALLGRLRAERLELPALLGRLRAERLELIALRRDL
jgi:hypothetical protein